MAERLGRLVVGPGDGYAPCGGDVLRAGGSEPDAWEIGELDALGYVGALGGKQVGEFHRKFRQRIRGPVVVPAAPHQAETARCRHEAVAAALDG